MYIVELVCKLCNWLVRVLCVFALSTFRFILGAF